MHGISRTTTDIRRAAMLASVVLVGHAGCHLDHSQSVLHTASQPAAEIAHLWWILLAVCGIVSLIVLGLLAFAVFSPQHSQQKRAPVGVRFIIVCGAIIPAVILVCLLIASVRTQVALSPPESSLTIRIVGHQFWWQVEYPEYNIDTANELYIPVDEPVRIELVSADVIHSFWVPSLQGKTDLLPDKVNVTWLSADRPGIYRGQCAEYCGVQHAWMAFNVIAVSRDEFDRWIAGCQQPTPQPKTESQRRGQELFVAEKCHNCHRIRGLPEAIGNRGPDLTHIASRKSLGAGLIPNNRGNLMGWISNPQALKPGNRMPATYLDSDELRALTDYLQTLK